MSPKARQDSGIVEATSAAGFDPEVNHTVEGARACPAATCTPTPPDKPVTQGEALKVAYVHLSLGFCGFLPVEGRLDSGSRIEHAL